MNTLTTAIAHYVATARARFQDEEGAAMVEYGLLIALIAVTVMVTLSPLGDAVADMFRGVTASVGGTPETTTAG